MIQVSCVRLHLIDHPLVLSSIVYCQWYTYMLCLTSNHHKKTLKFPFETSSRRSRPGRKMKLETHHVQGISNPIERAKHHFLPTQILQHNWWSIEYPRRRASPSHPFPLAPRVVTEASITPSCQLGTCLIISLPLPFSPPCRSNPQIISSFEE